ncbi:hypothetical protein [Nocardia sp. NPDC059691]|uniref:hypothetical protein n=1 Tax=Nocardia sp. NPDC059691 TaxID=3346908 RepID=UPI0036C52D69
MTSNQPHGCNPGCEPWISAGHCGVFGYDNRTGELIWVKCPSMMCFGQRVPVVSGRLADHSSPMDAPDGEKCPWIGIRVALEHRLLEQLQGEG